ncbi:MAG: hypothetical protein IIC50_07045 [Planctomycetes bacterium]|nr:hypothetical protein [Planctomycetota bacterium]
MFKHLLSFLMTVSLTLFAATAVGQDTACVDMQVVEDFEAYNDDCELIFYAWTDGLGHDGSPECGVDPYAGNNTGSIVGNESTPFAEQRYVHGGSQALVMGYDNAGALLVSTTERQFESPLDLTAGGIMEGLRLWFQGRAGSAGSISENAGTYTMTGAGLGIGAFADSFFFAYQPLNGNVTVIARIDSMTAAKGKAGAMIRSGLEPDDTHVSAYVTAEGRATFQFRIQKGGNTHITTSTATDAQWIRLSRSGDTFTGEYSTNGSTWLPILSDDPLDPAEITFPIIGDLRVGLALTAGSVGTASDVVFSNVTITGGVSGGPLMDSQEIGIISNDPAPLSIGLEDASGTRVLIAHEAGDQALLVNYWKAWEIPLAAFAPVDLSNVTKIILTVGDDQTEARGTLYVDDVATIRRVSMPWAIRLFAEDFEGLDLGPNIDESVAGDTVVTQSPPAGWTLDDSGVDQAGDPDNGVDEWEGWSFADKTWWATVDDQRRTEFARACGTVAVADSDEYDDKGNTGSYNAFMSTPAIDVLSVLAGEDTLMLRFDSSWRPESAQTANITASFDGGAPIEILRWESSGDLYHDHATNEAATVTFGRPVGAQKMVLTFGYFDASNNWWWAIDNLEVLGEPRIFLLREDFESLPLGPNVEESIGTEVVQAWTDTPPAGWTIDESGVPGVGNPATDGVTEWAGWAFTNKDWWTQVAGDQRRSEFVLGQGNVAVADPDEWDDASHPGPISEDPYDTWLTTPVLDISNIIPGTLKVSFDSSWRPEFDSDYHQSANITVSYDGGEPIEVLRWESDPGSPFFKNDNSTNESLEIELNNPPKAQTAQITFGMFEAGNDWWWALDNLAVTGLPFEPIVAFTENFDGLTLRPSVEEDQAAPSDMAWTDAPPEGWTIDNSGTTEGGTVEFDGWTFVARDWWNQIGQNREQFTLASGTVAVADPDEWDDFLEGDGRMNSLLTTPVIDVSALGTGTAELSFDSSWRREDTQTAIVTVSYDGGEPVEILRWESEGADTGFVKDDAENEHVVVAMNNPIGAQTAVVTFAMLEGGNDWWWAIDNVMVAGQPKSNAVRLLSEDFEGVPLGLSPEESPPTPQLVWSEDLPADWVRDNSAIPVDGENNGVDEWLGWHVANKDWWSFVAGNQRRAEFSLGEGAVLIADSDEWDDLPHPAGSYDAFIDMPAIDVSSAGGNLTLQFASSWRPEVNQTATITASFDGGAPVEILRWESGGFSAFYHAHLPNESVTVDFSKPGGAQSLVLTLGYFQTSNNWWWAVDNLELSSNGNLLFAEDFEGVALQLPVEEAQSPPPADIAAIWSNVPPAGWFNDNSLVPGVGDPTTDGVTDWAGWAFANKDWWVQAAGDQERSQFALGQGTVAVADPDEWDDAAHPEGLMNAFLVSPVIEIPTELLAGTLRLKFDSSWRREDTQTAIITVSYDGGEPFEVLRWESEGADTGFLKDDATSESVNVDLQSPEGATQMVITFGMVEAGNDWWWAIDNVEVVGELAP